MSIFFKSFDEKLEDIIKQGDTSQEYRNLFNKIVRLHKKHFTEENQPTTENYLQELLREAIEHNFQFERITDLLQRINHKTELWEKDSIKPEPEKQTSKYGFINAKQ